MEQNVFIKYICVAKVIKMRYLKFQPNHIFDGYRFLDSGKVLISKEDGTIVEIMDASLAGEDIQMLQGILTPGFINAHCHLELSHLKGKIPKNTGLVSFVQEVMKQNFSAQSFEDKKQQAIKNAEEEMYRSGIVAVGDICNTTDSIKVKQYSQIHWQNFIEVSGFVDSLAERRLNDTKNISLQFQAQNLSSTIVPHAPYSVSKTLFQLINNESTNQLISIHNQECEAENKLYKNKTGDFLELYKNFGIDISAFEPSGKTSLRTYLPNFTNNQSIIFVHNTFTKQEDLDNLQHPTSNIQHSFCLCPNANLYIEQKLPPLDLLRKNNCHIVIGTDSYASNHQLNILEEIKTIQQKNETQIPLQEMLQWATINGAKPLQVENRLGSFEAGKKPGIVQITDMDNLQLTSISKSLRLL